MADRTIECKNVDCDALVHIGADGISDEQAKQAGISRERANELRDEAIRIFRNCCLPGEPPPTQSGTTTVAMASQGTGAIAAARNPAVLAVVLGAIIAIAVRTILVHRWYEECELIDQEVLPVLGKCCKYRCLDGIEFWRQGYGGKCSRYHSYYSF